MATANRTVKVFCSQEDMADLSAKYRVVQEYDSFMLLKVGAAEAKALARKYPVEDITSQFRIAIGGREINTARPRVDALGIVRAHSAYQGVKKLPPGKHHYLVQFVGPVKKSWLAGLKRLGAEPRVPHANFAYVVRCDEATLKKLTAQSYVRWVGHLSHKDRIQIGDPSRRLPRTRLLQGVYEVEFFGKDDLRKAAAQIRKLGFKILTKDEKARLMTLKTDRAARGAGGMIDKLSAIHGVSGIRERALKRTSNDVATQIMRTAKSIKAPLNLSGEGEIVAVCDTGLDTGDASNIHEDFAGRIEVMKSYPITSVFDQYIDNPGGDDGPADLDSGHGTHVAGSVLSSGASSAGLPGQDALIRGLAYKARLVLQAIEQELKWKDFSNEQRYGRYLLAGIPDDITELFQYAYNKGARLHSNSWGGGNPGEYDSQCRQLDQFVWYKKDFCIVVAAGNDGTDKDGDGKINPMSVTSPGTAKNCITVGACESLRTQFNNETYGMIWPTDYPAPPYKDDPMADKPEQVVAFSSRGPTRDGRVKPDVVAPGTFILSTRSRKIAQNNNAWAPFPLSKQYFYMGGTSMATPLVSGAVAVLRQFFREWVGYDSPSAALIKASLVAGATKLAGYSSASQTCDNDQGFGRVDLDAVVAPPSPIKVHFLDDTTGLDTGGSDEFSFKVTSSEHPLRVAMAYSDYPGETLINNLNLLLTDPDGRHYVGNGPVGGTLEMDSSNNVEVVHVKSPQRGAWKLQIIASNVPQGPQAYAFALRGCVSE
jgi:serine protease AprX